MALLIEMQKLAQDLLDDYDARLKTVADLRSEVKQELSDFRTTHQTMTDEQQKHFETYINSLHNDVVEAGQATRKFLKELDEAHQVMTTEQREKLTEYMTLLHGQVTEASQETIDFLKGINQEHQTITKDQQQRLNEEMDRLRKNVEDLRSVTIRFMKGLAAERQSMAAEQQKRFSTDHARLSADVTITRQELQAKHHEAQIDLQQTHLLWANLKQLKGNKRPQQDAIQPAKRHEAPQVGKPTSVMPLNHNDLMSITGIGPGMAKLLNQNGITSIEQLAASLPDTIRQALGKAARLARVESWIEQASQLIS